MNELYAFIWSKPFKHLWIKCLILHCRLPVAHLRALISVDGPFAYPARVAFSGPVTPWMQMRGWICATLCNYSVVTGGCWIGFYHLPERVTQGFADHFSRN